MKTKRFLSIVLALLLVCSLPVSAFAMGNNPEGTTVPEIPADETMTTNNGTVTSNYGTVETNYGTVETNETGGEVTNNGTADDHDNAKVDINNGTVTSNYGTVDTNAITGTVTNYGGTVDKNYGTVIDDKGNDGSTTWYGVQVVGENNGDPLPKEEGVDLDLNRFTKAGHVLTGYIQGYQKGENGPIQLDSPITVHETSYTADCPNVLTLIWQAIVNPGSGENAAADDDGAADFDPGLYISINGHQYMLVAVMDDVYCLASLESYEAEELADLPALLASLLTEEQLGHVTGEAELLDQELTAHFFGGRGSHIVFPCDKGLIYS